MIVISLIGLGSSDKASGDALLGGGVGAAALAAAAAKAEALRANWVEASS
jgi:hypothetical protein